MNKEALASGRMTVFLAVLTAVGLIAVFAVERSSAVGTRVADGRALTGDYCLTPAPANSPRCMQITWDGVQYGTNNRTALTLRPGTYWLTVNDTGQFAAFHNFELRSCLGSTSDCVPGTGTEQEITGIPQVGSVTVPVLLKAGTYRLFCDAMGHEASGMYVAFEVGGVGQLDS